MYIKAAFSAFPTLSSRMDRLTLLAVLWAAAGTNSLISSQTKGQFCLQGLLAPAACLSAAPTCLPRPLSGCWARPTPSSSRRPTSPTRSKRPTCSVSGWSSLGSAQRWALSVSSGNPSTGEAHFCHRGHGLGLPVQCP